MLGEVGDALEHVFEEAALLAGADHADGQFVEDLAGAGPSPRPGRCRRRPWRGPRGRPPAAPGWCSAARGSRGRAAAARRSAAGRRAASRRSARCRPLTPPAEPARRRRPPWSGRDLAPGTARGRRASAPPRARCWRSACRWLRCPVRGQGFVGEVRHRSSFAVSERQRSRQSRAAQRARLRLRTR